MNDTSGKSSSSLAIAEKRPQRPGGCVGIFFQLFDWNRRLAKKKLFSKKLLPPVRAKRVSKKFGGDEKLPMAKLLLIADENRGGFPNAKKSEVDSVNSSANAERTHEMRSPGLVARLMGLESMPAERQDKPKKAAFSEIYHDLERKSQNIHSSTTSELLGCDRDDFNFEKGHTRLESRPQKLQKTGIFERRPITRFGAEALQFKNVLSCSKKHHPKLASPVKSPRVFSGRNATRLMEAATKILEPGLQATNRAKCALTYSPSLHFPPKDEVMAEGATVISPDQSKQPSYYASSAKSLKEQSCKSCSNLLDVMDFRSNGEEQVQGFASSNLDFSTAPLQGSGKSKSKPAISSFEQERDVVVLKNQDRPVSLGTQAKANIRTRNANFIDRKPQFRDCQDQRLMSSQRTKSQKDVASTVPKQKTQKHNQMSLAKDRVPTRPKSNNLQSRRDSFAFGSANGAKDFVALNRNSSSHSRARMPSKVLDICKIDIERNACDKKDDPSSRLRVSLQKSRSTNGTAQVENTGFIQPTFGKQRNVGGHVIIGREVGPNAFSVNQNSVKSKCPSKAKGDAAGGSKDIDIVSFTFSSPMRQSAESSSPTDTMEKRRGPDELMSSSASYQKNLDSGNTSSQIATQLRGDALGALLEEKLRELTCQERDELEIGNAVPGRSTASILQELISALTAGRSASQEDGVKCSVGFSQKDSLFYQDPSDGISTLGQMFSTNRNFQAGGKAAGFSVGFPLASDGDHPSPGSVLEASFLNDSCFSESLDDSSGHKLHPWSRDCSYDQVQQSDPVADLLDSATSLNTGNAENDWLTDSVNNISRMLYGINPASIGLVGSMLNHAREVITHAELLLGNTAPCDANGTEDFPTGSLLDNLERLSDDLWRSTKCNMGFMEAKDGHLLKRFLYDFVIEYLDSKYGHYCKSGYKTWLKRPLHISGELLAREVYEEIRRWIKLDGKTPDEMIEREMSHSMAKWTDFEIEAFETGIEIEWDVLEILVDEIVIDLWQYRVGSS